VTTFAQHSDRFGSDVSETCLYLDHPAGLPRALRRLSDLLDGGHDDP